MPESFFCFVMPDIVFIKGRFFRAILCVAVFLLAPCLISEARGQETSWRIVRLERAVNRQLPDIESVFSPWEHLGRMRVDSPCHCATRPSVLLKMKYLTGLAGAFAIILFRSGPVGACSMILCRIISVPALWMLTHRDTGKCRQLPP